MVTIGQSQYPLRMADPTGLVIDRGDGRHLHPATADHRLERLCEAAGVPRLSPHGLRHTVITLAALAGVPLPVIQARVGHGSIAVTADVYVAVPRDADRAAADRLASLLAGRTGADETPGNRPAATAAVTTDPEEAAG